MTSRINPVPCMLVGLASITLAASTATAISSRTLISPSGSIANENLGFAVELAGDVNGDEFPDIIIGAPGEEKAYVYYGGPDGDDVPDLILTGENPNDRFGSAVSSAGDVNDDGYDDIIVGAWSNDAAGPEGGRAYVFLGGPAPDTVADLVVTGARSNNYFGYSVATARDFNDDGYDDILVGAYGHNSSVGRAYIYLGGAALDATPDFTFTGGSTNYDFGWDVSPGGDINGDGYDDVLVGEPGYASDRGQTHAFFGGPAADTNPDRTYQGQSSSYRFGAAVAAAGDVNGDGWDDVLVGAHQYSSNQGRARLFYGGPGADVSSDRDYYGETSNNNFGWAVAGAGDINSDGYDDLLIGAYSANSSSGRAYVYFGDSSPSTSPAFTMTGTNSNDFLGYSVASAGDFDGDGDDDILVGAHQTFSADSNAGRAFVTSVYAYQILSPNGGESWIVGSEVTVQFRGHDPADIDVSLDAGSTWSTIATAQGGDEENEITIVAPVVPTLFAKIRIYYTGQVITTLNSKSSRQVFRLVNPSSPPKVAAQPLASAAGSSGDVLGAATAAAGDFNADGFADAVVGSPGNGGGAGRASVLLGGPGSDAVGDIQLIGSVAGDSLGHAVAGIGDINGDGFDDIAVGGPRESSGGADAGAVNIYLGGPGADGLPDISLHGSTGDQFGASVGGAGDVNGDGYDDLLVGAPYSSAAGFAAGAAYLFFGRPNLGPTADLEFLGLVAGDEFGFSVSGAGDVNSDGYSDWIIGAPGNDIGGIDAGRGYLYLGGPAPDVASELRFTGFGDGDRLGHAVAGVGDVNGDGFDDVAAGAPYAEVNGADAGRCLVFFGGPAANPEADVILNGVAAGDEFGFAVSSAGDANRDGLGDLLVGAPGFDSADPDVGRASLFHGGFIPDTSPDANTLGTIASGRLGAAIGAVDLTGDGFRDMVLGTPGAGTGPGGVAIQDINRYFLLAPTGGETWPVGSVQTVRWRGAEPANVWLSVDGGAQFQPLLSDAGGQGLNAVQLRVPHLPTRFARVRVAPSNIDLIGTDTSDSLFTIETSIALLSFRAGGTTDGSQGVLLRWETDPAPEQLAGYHLERADGTRWTTLAALLKETHYLDRDGRHGSRYRLSAVNGLGAEYLLGEAVFRTAQPLAAWPVPYREGVLSIDFSAPGGFGGGASPVELSLYDVTGRRVRTIVRGPFEQGHYEAGWDGLDDEGQVVGSGVYFLRLTSLGSARTSKVVVAR